MHEVQGLIIHLSQLFRCPPLSPIIVIPLSSNDPSTHANRHYPKNYSNMGVRMHRDLQTMCVHTRDKHQRYNATFVDTSGGIRVCLSFACGYTVPASKALKHSQTTTCIDTQMKMQQQYVDNKENVLLHVQGSVHNCSTYKSTPHNIIINIHILMCTGPQHMCLHSPVKHDKFKSSSVYMFVIVE